MITISLDSFERRNLTCSTCEGELVRKIVKREWKLVCPQCHAEWLEKDIRRGIATGLKYIEP